MFSMNYFRLGTVCFSLALTSFCSAVISAQAALELKPTVAKQGQTIEVLVSANAGDASASPESSTSDGGAGPTIHFRKKDYKTFPDSARSDMRRTLLSVPADLPVGTYSIKCGGEVQNIKVVAGGFGVQTISLPKGKDNFKASPGEEATVDAAKATVSEKQLWDGKFIRPVESRISSTFGLRRRVNGKLLTDYFHSGLDFAAPAGRPVHAVQKGKVLIAKTGWKLHGNTVCIDHGQGVLSFYIHLSKVNVKEGDMVETGQTIGAVGSTGRANGPHLHFSIYVNNDATNPGDWFANAF